MQNQSNIIYLPYRFEHDFPFYEWGAERYSPPTITGKLHRHNCFEIGCCFEGSGVFLAENEMLSFAKGDCSVVFPGKAHIASSNPQEKSSWHFVMIDLKAFCKFEGLEMFGENEKDMEINLPHIFSMQTNPHICMLIRMIVEQFSQKTPEYKNIAFFLTQSLLFHIKELCVKSEAIMRDEKYNSIVPALNYISNFYRNSFAVEELARICNMSESTFRRIFKSVIGKSPMDFVYETRMKVAEDLLSQRRYAIYQIAEMVGYESLSSFNRHFKKYKHTSPKEYLNNA